MGNANQSIVILYISEIRLRPRTGPITFIFIKKHLINLNGLKSIRKLTWELHYRNKIDADNSHCYDRDTNKAKTKNRRQLHREWEKGSRLRFHPYSVMFAGSDVTTRDIWRKLIDRTIHENYSILQLLYSIAILSIYGWNGII